MDRSDDVRAFPGTTRAGTIAAGVGLGLALLVLWGASLGDAPLPWAILAALIAGAFLLLALLNAFELLAGSADPTGGVHALVHEVTGGVVGFMTGWWVTSASLALLALLARLAGDHAAALLAPWVSLDPRWLAVALLACLIGLHLLGGDSPPAWVWIPAALAALLLALRLLRWLPGGVGLLEPSLPDVASWLALTYAPLELTLSLRRWVRASVFGGGQGGFWRRPLLIELLVMLVPLIGAALLLPSLGRAEEIIPALRLAWLSGPSGGAALGLLVVLGILLLGLSGALRLSARSLGTMARLGGIPLDGGRRMARGRERVGALLVALVGVVLLVWLLPIDWLEEVTRLGWLIPPLVLSAVAAYSREVEPERRRPLQLPFHPMVPGLALILGLGLLSGVARAGWLSGAVWSATGLLVYVVYARRHQVAAQVGASIFTGPGLPPKPEGGFRVLVPLRSVSALEREQVFPFAMALAEATGGDVLLLRVIPVPDPLAAEETRRLAQAQDEYFRWAVAAGEAAGNVHSVTRLARSRAEGILDTAVEANCDLILISADVPERRAPLGRVVDPVARWATRDVAVVMRRGDDGARPVALRRILLPTRGGSHMSLAVRLAFLLARSSDAEVTVANAVDSRVSAEEVAEAEATLARAIEQFKAQAKALEVENVAVVGRILQGDRPAQTITEAAADYDVVIMGASEMGLLDRVLFGTVPEDVARASQTPVIVVRRYAGLPKFWLRRLWDAVFAAVPKLDSEQQVEVYRQIRRGARSRADFLIMISLASLIATFGLQQNNPAVIIGAMLVAPFFSPVIALSLGIAHGDVRLLRVAIESTLKGVFLVLALSFLISAAVPLRSLTPEMTSRMQPGLLDLGVALAAGAAGAFAVSRKGVSTSLPGVAIAAALVPPLSVVAIGAAWGQWNLAAGALLLFGTNLVAISLAGALLFLMVGFRPAPRRQGQERLRWGLILVLLSLVLVAAPLALVSGRSLQLFQVRRQVEAVISSHLEDRLELRMVDVLVEDGAEGLEVTVTIAAGRSIASEEVADLERELEDGTGRAVSLGLVVWPLIQASAGEGAALTPSATPDSR